jgi:hypothetical protein
LPKTLFDHHHAHCGRNRPKFAVNIRFHAFHRKLRQTVEDCQCCVFSNKEPTVLQGVGAIIDAERAMPNDERESSSRLLLGNLGAAGIFARAHSHPAIRTLGL